MPKKKLIVIVAVVVVALLGLLLIFGGGRYSSPENTLKTMIRSMEKGDIDGYLECLTEDSQKLLVDSGVKDQDPEDLKKGMEDYEDPEFKVVEKEGDKAIMKSDKESSYLVFKKEDKGWKLDLEETFQKMFEEAMKGATPPVEE